MQNIIRKGASHHACKLTADAVLRIRRLYDGGTPIRTIAAAFEVSQSRIVAIGKRRTWCWLAEEQGQSK
jgi:hypothetical protein